MPRGRLTAAAGAAYRPGGAPTSHQIAKQMNRREFVARGAAAAAGLSLLPRGVAHAARLPPSDPEYRELAMRALDAARTAGATYADVRINRNRSQAVSTRERRITGFQDAETFGFGVRVLAGGAWGFAAVTAPA